MPNKTRYLLVDALDARQHYLTEALKLLMRYGTLKMHGLAYGLYPNRTMKAAMAAAHRVASHALKLGFIRSADDPGTRFRYYALTAAGARFLREHGGPDDAESTTHLLKKLTRAHHREWTNLCSIAAIRRQLESYAETDYFRKSFRAELLERFGHIPDALTYAEIGNIPTVVWHEIELSRRSMRNLETRPLAPGELDRSGIGKWLHLLGTLRQRRVLTHKGTDHQVRLVVHCANSTLLSILAKHLKHYAERLQLPYTGKVHVSDSSLPAHLQTPIWAQFQLPFASRGTGMFGVLLQLLPNGGEDTRDVWHDCDAFPWQGADGSLELDQGFNEQFMVP
jgi:hypothetical protein